MKLCSWEGNCRSSIALITFYTLQGLRKRDRHSTNAVVIYGTISPFTSQHEVNNRAFGHLCNIFTYTSGGAVVQWVRHLGLRSVGRGFKSCSRQRNNLRQVVYTYVPVIKQYNLVPVKGWWCSAAGEVTAGLAESNGSLQPGGWLTVTCLYTGISSGPNARCRVWEAFTFFTLLGVPTKLCLLMNFCRSSTKTNF